MAACPQSRCSSTVVNFPPANGVPTLSTHSTLPATARFRPTVRPIEHAADNSDDETRPLQRRRRTRRMMKMATNTTMRSLLQHAVGQSTTAGRWMVRDGIGSATTITALTSVPSMGFRGTLGL
eukprot:6207988-Pleurochrysis_carterae.AAC.1